VELAGERWGLLAFAAGAIGGVLPLVTRRHAQPAQATKQVAHARTWKEQIT
jgi:hypothetical protein